jgi:methylene-tetrahydromethanopterin dehydrogenase
MLERAGKAMVPPFVVSVFADPSGAFTTAAALVASVEAALRAQDATGLEGKRVLLLGGTGPVGRIAGVLCAQCGATAVLASHRGAANAVAAAGETGKRFDVSLEGASTASAAELRAALATADVALGVAAAGVQVMSEADRDSAPRLRVAADVNAVPPAGIAGVGVMDDAKPIPGTQVVGIGALAIGNVKYRTESGLFKQMTESKIPLRLDFRQAFELARTLA